MDYKLKPGICDYWLDTNLNRFSRESCMVLGFCQFFLSLFGKKKKPFGSGGWVKTLAFSGPDSNAPNIWPWLTNQREKEGERESERAYMDWVCTVSQGRHERDRPRWRER